MASVQKARATSARKRHEALKTAWLCGEFNCDYEVWARSVEIAAILAAQDGKLSMGEPDTMPQGEESLYVAPPDPYRADLDIVWGDQYTQVDCSKDLFSEFREVVTDTIDRLRATFSQIDAAEREWKKLQRLPRRYVVKNNRGGRILLRTRDRLKAWRRAWDTALDDGHRTASVDLLRGPYSMPDRLCHDDELCTLEAAAKAGAA